MNFQGLQGEDGLHVSLSLLYYLAHTTQLVLHI